MTLAACADALGLKHARSYQRYETGANPPDALMIERIRIVTGGQVSVEDLHRQRLDWITENRPASLDPLSAVRPFAPREAAE